MTSRSAVTRRQVYANLEHPSPWIAPLSRVLGRSARRAAFGSRRSATLGSFPPRATTRPADSGARSARFKPIGALAFVLFFTACASLEPRPPLPPLPERPAGPATPAETPKDLAARSSEGLRLTRQEAKGSFELVTADMPKARYVAVSLVFPRHPSPRIQRTARLLLRLLSDRLSRALPVGADDFYFSRGAADHIGFVGLPGTLEAGLDALGKTLANPGPAFKNYKEVKSRYLQDLSNRPDRRMNLLRIGRFGSDHEWAEGPATRINALAKIKKSRMKKDWPIVFDLSHATLAIAASPEVMPSAEKLRGYFTPGAPRARKQKPAVKVPPLRKDGGHRFHAWWYDDEQVFVYAYHVGPAPTHPDYKYFRLISNIFDGGFRGEANRSLRHDRGATYGVGSSVRTSRDLSELTFGGPLLPEEAFRLMAVHRSQVERLLKGEVEAVDLERAARSESLRSAQRRHDPESVADDLASCAAHGIEPTFEACLSPHIGDLKLERLIEVAQRYLSRDRIEWAFLGELDTIHNRLRFQGELIFYKRGG